MDAPQKIAAQFYCQGSKYRIVEATPGVYDIYCDEERVQFNLSSIGTINYLAAMVHNTSYLLNRERNQTNKL